MQPPRLMTKRMRPSLLQRNHLQQKKMKRSQPLQRLKISPRRRQSPPPNQRQRKNLTKLIPRRRIKRPRWRRPKTPLQQKQKRRQKQRKQRSLQTPKQRRQRPLMRSQRSKVQEEYEGEEWRKNSRALSHGRCNKLPVKRTSNSFIKQGMIASMYDCSQCRMLLNSVSVLTVLSSALKCPICWENS